MSGPASLATPPTVDRNAMSFLASVLRCRLNLFVSTSCPLYLATVDLPDCALVSMVLHNAAFFGVEMFFFNFHFLIWCLY